MGLMLIGMAVFFTAHLSLRLAPIQGLKAKMGMPFKGLFSVFALTGIILIIMGFSQFRPIATDVFIAPNWAKHLNYVFTIAAFILFVASYMKGRISCTLKHPQLIGVALWAFGHLLANGDLASVILFGGFCAWAILTIMLQPKTAIEPLKWCRNDEASIAFGLLGWVAMAFKLHPLWFGVVVIG